MKFSLALFLIAGLSVHEAFAAQDPAAQTPAPQTASNPAKLTRLDVSNLSPSFDPDVTDYTVARTTACALQVTAKFDDTDTELTMYVGGRQTDSGETRSAWVCDGRTKVDIVLYRAAREVRRYTVSVATPSMVLTLPASPVAAEPTPTITIQPVVASAAEASPPAAVPTAPVEAAPSMTPPAPTPVAPHMAAAPAPSISAATEQEEEFVPEPAPTPSPVVAGEHAVPPLSAVDGSTAARFLEAATFGPSPSAIANLQPSGIQQWLTAQFAMPESEMPDGLDVNGVRARLFTNMYSGADQLRQRTMFALSSFIVVSSRKNNTGAQLIPWVRLLSRYAFDNYRTLLREVTLNPTMGNYLDLVQNRRATSTRSANENYARELMQLFSIGVWELNQDGSPRLDAQGQRIATYDQTTVRELARALTGWTYPTAEGSTPVARNPPHFIGLLEPRTADHDPGAKVLFGRTIPANQTPLQDLEMSLDIIFQHPNVPPFVATRLIRSLVGSNPSPAYIRRVADVFANNGQGARGDLRAVVTAILTDQEALTQPPSRLTDPVLHIIGMGRTLDAQIGDPNTFMSQFGNLGQLLLSPATVFGFYSPLGTLPGNTAVVAPEFQIYPPALAVQRANFIYAILNGQYPAFAVNLTPFTSIAADPAALVERVNQTLMRGRMSRELRQIITRATLAVPATDARQRAIGALFLAAISTEYTVPGGLSSIICLE